MTNDNQRTDAKRMLAYAFLGVFVVFALYNALFSFSYSVGPNYRNISIDTRVNITDAKPEVLAVTVEDPITLNPGGIHVVACNATVRDWNGYADITNVSAVFWDNVTQTYASSDDNNDHYTNVTCNWTGDDGNYTRYFTCNFSVEYYANAGTDWVCNVTATDSYAFNSSVGDSDSNYNITTVTPYYALNVTSLIDYGDMAVGDTSAAKDANITNFGNQNINISLKGYGSVENDGLAFVCDVGNITIDNEKFSLNQTGDYVVDYTSLTTAYQQVLNLTLPQQTNDSVQVTNTTYWRLYVPPNPFGQCNGTIVFQAESAN